MNNKEQTARALELLRYRHQPPEWATFVELRPATGSGLGGIDFFAMNVWRSKDYHRIAYEVKATRGDFAREIDNPDKRAPAEVLANQTFFVAPSGLIKSDEVPEGWGLLEMHKSGLRRTKIAKQREIGAPPIAFVASMARRTSDPRPKELLALWKYAGHDLTQDQLMEIAREEIETWKERVEGDAVKAFRQGDEFKELAKLRGIIYRYLDVRYSEPDRFEKWMISQDRQVIDRNLRYQLQETRNSLNRLLEKVNERT